jgi:hypothetical protein
MGSYVLGLQEIHQTQVALVGGKGAQLGELSRIEGIYVPAGFCVTTDAFRRIIADARSIEDRLDRLARLDPDDRGFRCILEQDVLLGPLVGVSRRFRGLNRLNSDAPDFDAYRSVVVPAALFRDYNLLRAPLAERRT